MRSQPTFHKFSSLPAELRLLVWKMALEEPTRVTLTISGYESRRSGNPTCGTVFSYPSENAATAVLPPLMLVNHESHAVTSRHYRRAFRSFNGKGGVLAAYPTVLTVKGNAFGLMRPGSLNLLRDFILEYEGHQCLQVPTTEGGKYWAILQAPNLKTFIVIARGQYGPAIPSLGRGLRRLFLDLVELDPNTNVPTIELRIGADSADRAEWTCYFRGSPLELPEE
jgi:hypothetical protein